MNLIKDWKKQASQQFHKDEIEKAFMDQAYAFIQNKAGRLLSDPHRLGFEIVFKNEACTRMVGIFAFRAGDRLLYVPCFFINGQVKGTDLLYDVDRKMFRPLDEEQVEFVLEAQSTRQGKGCKNDDYMQRSMDVHKLVVPPSGRGVKFASEDEIQQDLQEMAKKAELQPILRSFIEDTGELTLEAIEETMQKSGAFARALARLDDGIWEPLPTKKQASEEPPADEGLFLIKGFGKFASDDLTQSHITKRGFSLEDSRNDLNTVEVDDVELQNISDPGVYDVVLADGTARRAFCIPDADTYYEGLHDDETEWAIGDRDRQHPTTLCIFEDGSVSRSDYRKPVYGMPRDEQPEEIKEPPTKEATMKGITEDPSSGYYHVYDPTTKCCVFLNLKSKRTNNGITTYTAARGPHKDSQTYELVHNPDTQTGSKEGDTVFLSNQTKFIKGKPEDASGAWSFCCKKGPALGNEDSIDRFLLSTDNVPAKLKASEKSAGMRFELSIGGRTTEDIDDLSMAVKLARDLKIPGDQALALLDMAEKQGSVRFWMQKPAMEKSGAMRLMDDPTFDRDFDSDYGTELDPGHAYALDVGQQQEPMRGRRIGDKADPEGFESRREAVLTQTPEQLAQMAKMQQLPNLFEHGVVGALANTYDAVVLIDRYIPDLEKAVDGLGRALFLFYWKPGEFQDAYGVDDMQNLEDELLSNFKALGDLTLNLSKRSSQPVGPGVASQM